MVVPVTGPTIEFRALGAPRLSSSGIELQSILVRPKLLGLLSFLAISAPGFHRRDTLLGLFWAEADQKRARRALRQSLYYLRQSLGPDVLVARGEDELGLDEGRLWSDVRAFESALDDGRRQEALELYRGDLLAGFYVADAPEYERWLDGRREELRRKASDAAWALARAAEADGNAAGAGHWARRGTALEPFDERLVTQAMELLDRIGDRSGALHLYDSFSRRLEQEFEIEPAPETQALVARIRSRIGTADDSTTSEPAVAEAGAHGGTAEPVRAVDEGTREQDLSGIRPVRRFHPRGRTRVLIGITLATAVAIALFLLLGPGVGEPATNAQRVVVAVFDNRTGDAELDPLGRMAADWITQALHESGVAEVVPSTIGLAPRPDFIDDEPDPAALAEATGAGTVILGAFYRRGDSVEIQAQVVDARQGNLLSALPPATSPLAMPGVAVDSLSRSVVRTLAVLFEPSLAASADLSRPPSLEAYRQYLEGLRNFQSIPLRMREALPYFYRAIELDSLFLAPWFYVIMTHANLGEFERADSNLLVLETQRHRLSEPQRHMLDWMLARMSGDQMGALEAARARGGIDVGVQALMVNRPAEAVDVLSAEDLSAAYFHWLTLMRALHVLGDYRRELDEARRGRDAYPARLLMLDAEARALAALGRVAEVGRIVDESLMLPNEDFVTPAMLMSTGSAEFRAHGFRQPSIELAERAIEWWQSRPGPETRTWQNRMGLALAYYQAERWGEAESVLREMASENPEDIEVLGYLGSLAARRADRTEALAISASLEGKTVRPQFGGDAYRQARIAALLGDRERAIALLREAVARGWAYDVWFHREMDLESLRGYPPFEEFIRPKG